MNDLLGQIYLARGKKVTKVKAQISYDLVPLIFDLRANAAKEYAEKILKVDVSWPESDVKLSWYKRLWYWIRNKG